MRAVLYNIRSIHTVPCGPSGCAKRALRAQNILSAVIFNSTCKIKIKSCSPMMACGLCCITLEAFILCPTGRVVMLNGLWELKTSWVLSYSIPLGKVKLHATAWRWHPDCQIPFEVSILCPTGSVVLLNRLPQLKTYCVLQYLIPL